MKTIYLIDDNPVNNLITRKLLETNGTRASFKSFTSGADALSDLSQMNAENTIPNVVFLDLQMPEMDGFDFLEALQKKYPVINNDLKIIVFSSTSEGELIEKATAHPLVFRFMVKPFRQDDIARLIAELRLG